MYQMSFVYLLIRGILEIAAVIAVGMSMINENFRLKSLCQLALIAGPIAAVVRILPLKPGIHSIIGILVCIILTHLLMKVSLRKTISANLIGFFSLALFEFLNFFVLISILKISREKIVSSDMAYFVSGLPTVILAYIVAFVKDSYNKKRKQKKNIGEEA